MFRVSFHCFLLFYRVRLYLSRFRWFTRCRFKCLSCFSFNVCQDCFVRGKLRAGSSHVNSHVMREYCAQVPYNEVCTVLSTVSSELIVVPHCSNEVATASKTSSPSCATSVCVAQPVRCWRATFDENHPSEFLQMYSLARTHLQPG